MKNRDVVIVMFSIVFGITCLLWACLWVVMAGDLSDKTKILEEEKSLLEQEIIQLRWENENNYMYCTNEE